MSGSNSASFASNQSRSSFRVNGGGGGNKNGESGTTPGSGQQQQQQQQLYNFPWDFKMKPNPILAQIANNGSSGGISTSSNAAVPPPLPTVPPPQTPRLSNGGMQSESSSHRDQQEQPEDQYCAPWDLKLQEEMLKRMALQKSKSSSDDDNENKKPDSPPTTNSNILSSNEPLNSAHQKVDSSNDYNMPWEMKQSILFQSLANGKPPPAPLATSSAVSTLTTNGGVNSGNGFNKMSASRLSTRSNASTTSSSSSRRSSTSSVSTNNNSPPQTMIVPPPPPSIPPPPITNSPSSNQHQTTSTTSLLSNHTSSSTLVNVSSSNNQSDHHQINCAIMQQQQQQSQNQAAILSPRLSANARLSSNTTCNCNISTINGSSGGGGQNKLFTNPINSTCLSNSSIHNFDGNVVISGGGGGGSSGTLNTSSSMFDNDASNPFARQNRAGSSHHFPLTHFQTVSGGGGGCGKKTSMDNSGNIQVAALPITALIFSQNSLPSNLINNMQSHHQQQQLFHQIASNQIVELQMYAWFHGSLTRKQAENLLANRPMGSFLVRQSESGNSNDCSLSLISGSGCVHMRICMKNGEFILGQCSQPFNSIVKMIEHYSRVEVPIKGAQHVKLTMPVPRM